VQQGRDLLQAAPTGYSAAITNRGTLLERTVLGAQQVVFATLSRRAGWTLYVRFGDLPVEVGAALALVGAWLLADRRNRPGGQGAPRAGGQGAHSRQTQVAGPSRGAGRRVGYS
jgi:apolipoprotein N-acyltransferase